MSELKVGDRAVYTGRVGGGRDDWQETGVGDRVVYTGRDVGGRVGVVLALHKGWVWLGVGRGTNNISGTLVVREELVDCPGKSLADHLSSDYNDLCRKLSVCDEAGPVLLGDGLAVARFFAEHPDALKSESWRFG